MDHARDHAATGGLIWGSCSRITYRGSDFHRHMALTRHNRRRNGSWTARAWHVQVPPLPWATCPETPTSQAMPPPPLAAGCPDHAPPDDIADDPRLRTVGGGLAGVARKRTCNDNLTVWLSVKV